MPSSFDQAALEGRVAFKKARDSVAQQEGNFVKGAAIGAATSIPRAFAATGDLLWKLRTGRDLGWERRVKESVESMLPTDKPGMKQGYEAGNVIGDVGQLFADPLAGAGKAMFLAMPAIQKGPKAKELANKLKQGMTMLHKRASPEEIYGATGWSKYNGLWYYHVDPRKASVITKGAEKVGQDFGTPLSEIMDFPEFYDILPSAKHVPVTVDPNLKAVAAFRRPQGGSPAKIILSKQAAEDLKGEARHIRLAMSAMLHETTHYGQSQGGALVQGGWSPEQVQTRLEALLPKGTFVPLQDARAIYMAQEGETFSRLVQEIYEGKQQFTGDLTKAMNSVEGRKGMPKGMYIADMFEDSQLLEAWKALREKYPEDIPLEIPYDITFK
jgi:hypothetical protein